MEKIIHHNEPFDFSKIVLTQPSPLQGGSYITKIRYNGEPLYLQFPKVLNRNGVIETNKKSYIDLMIDNENNEFIEWLENLESELQQKIYEKRELWFDNELDLEDIENAFSTCCRPYKGGKLHLVRINIPKNKSISQQSLCNVYDENQNEIFLKDIQDSNYLITIIEFYGVRFSSKSFQIELFAKQVMCLQNKKLFNNCVIKTNNENSTPLLKQEYENNQEINQQVNQEINQEVNIKYNNLVESNEKTNIEDNQSLDLLENASIDINTENTKSNNEDKKDEIISKHIEDSSNDNNNVNKDLETIETYESNNLENTHQDLEDLEEKEIQDITQNIENIFNDSDGITLKKQNEVYYEMYKIAKEKARNAKKLALEAYLEAKNIKKEHMLDDIDSSDDDSDASSYEDTDDEDDLEAKNEVENIIESLE